MQIFQYEAARADEGRCKEWMPRTIDCLHVYVIESHILVTLTDADKSRTPEDVDKIVSAEIPDPLKPEALFCSNDQYAPWSMW